MNYFVIGPNGELYGPADIATLNQWILQGRLLPTTMIQEELGGARFAASMLRELNFARPGERPGYAIPQPTYGVDPGAQEVKLAWIYGSLGLLCCSLCSPIGIYYAVQARKKGSRSASAPFIFCIIVTALNIISIFLLILLKDRLNEFGLGGLNR